MGLRPRFGVSQAVETSVLDALSPLVLAPDLVAEAKGLGLVFSEVFDLARLDYLILETKGPTESVVELSRRIAARGFERAAPYDRSAAPAAARRLRLP
jgi:hypothetical protein